MAPRPGWKQWVPCLLQDITHNTKGQNFSVQQPSTDLKRWKQTHCCPHLGTPAQHKHHFRHSEIDGYVSGHTIGRPCRHISTASHSFPHQKHF